MKYILSILLCLAVIVFVLATFTTFTSCNPTKRAYKKIEKLEPKSKADTTRLLKRAMTVIKPTQPKTLPGKTIRVPYPVNKIVAVLDSNRLKAITDSLYLANGQILDCTRQIEEACKVCRQQAYYELRNITYETKEPDTVLIPDPATLAGLQLVNMQLVDSSIALRHHRTTIAKYEAERDSLGWAAKRTFALFIGKFWWLILFAIGLPVGFKYLKLRSKFPLP